MPQTAERLGADDRASERQNAILDAAACCFARAGFHRTTMQDVAVEARMSPGNLYRYFTSKNALIAGLVERDRAELAADFAARPGADLSAGLRELGRKHFVDAPVEKSRLCLQIWAEATRDPAIAALHADFDQEMLARLAGLFESGKASGAIPASVNCAAAARIAMKLADGMFVRRAAGAHYDAEQELAELFAVIDALLDGTVPLPEPTSRPE